MLIGAFNPSWLPEVVHRHVGNLSYAGLLLAGWAGARFLFSRHADRAYYDWMGHPGLLLGFGLALLQPIGGWFYARQVQLASPEAYERMMIRENSWLFLLQTLFLGTVFLLGNVYLASAIERGSPSVGTVSWMRRSLLALGIAVILAIIPKEWPLGQMMPWKYISLVAMVLLGLINLLLYLRARPGFAWGNVGRQSQMSLVGIAVTIVALIVTMGIIRESSRGSDLIYKRLGPGQSQQFQSP